MVECVSGVSIVSVLLYLVYCIWFAIFGLHLFFAFPLPSFPWLACSAFVLKSLLPVALFCLYHSLTHLAGPFHVSLLMS